MATSDTLICFSTQGQWTARDVTSLIGSVSEIYDVFSVYRIAAKIQRSQEEAFLYSLERYEKHLDSPMHFEWYRLWRDLLRDWRKYRYKSAIPFPMLPSPFPIPGAGKDIPEQIEILENIELYRDIVEELKIDRIHIASPGGFSFSGLGEIVQQFRELIKDIWYRNKQEKTKGELEIVEQYLRIGHEYPNSNLPPVSAILVDRKMSKKVQSNIENMRRLEREGKLLPPPEYVDKRPE
jgi:hypothetical protein